MQATFFDRHRSLSALRYRDFRLLLAGSALVGFVQPLHFMTQLFWVEDTFPERDVLYIALIAGARGLALLIFSLLGGAIADRFERRRILLACESGSFVITACVAAVMLFAPAVGGTIAVVCALSFLGAGLMSIDTPARSASIPAVVGMESVGNAVSLNSLAIQFSLPIVLPIAGILNTFVEPGLVFAGSLFAWALILPLIAMLRFRSIGSGDRRQGIIGNISEGLLYSWRTPAIFAVIAIVFAVQVLGMPGVATLGPVYLLEVLELEPAQVGFMAMTWGIGAFAGSFLMARAPGLPVRGRTLCIAALAFGCGVLLFSYSRFPPLTAFANIILGSSLSAMMITSTTIIQNEVSEEMRGRVLGLFPLAMGLSSLAAAPVGAAGEWLGLPVVVPALGWTTILIVALIMVWRPQLRTLEPAHPPEPAGLPAA